MFPQVARGCCWTFQQRSQSGVKDRGEGNLGVCSPLQLTSWSGPSGTRAWCRSLVPGAGLWCCSTEVPHLPLLPPGSKTLAQSLPACFSLQRAPVSHWAPESLLSLGGRASRASTSWGNRGCLYPPPSYVQQHLSRAGCWAKPRWHRAWSKPP